MNLIFLLITLFTGKTVYCSDPVLDRAAANGLTRSSSGKFYQGENSISMEDYYLQINTSPRLDYTDERFYLNGVEVSREEYNMAQIMRQVRLKVRDTVTGKDVIEAAESYEFARDTIAICMGVADSDAKLTIKKIRDAYVSRLGK